MSNASSKKIEVNIILAGGNPADTSKQHLSVIGKNGDLPWAKTEDGDIKMFKKVDLNNFKSLSVGHAVMMGRKTWESLPASFRPLPDRYNMILSKSNPPKKEDQNLIFLNDIQSGIDYCNGRFVKLFIIGGSSVYHEAVKKGLVDNIYFTNFPKTFDGDTYVDMVDLTLDFVLHSRTSFVDRGLDPNFTICHYKRSDLI